MANPKSKVDPKNNQVVFWLKSAVYPLEAVYSTAYVFLDRVYVYLDGDPEKEIEVHLKGKEKLTEKELKAIQGEFLNELLNYLLRVEIARNNQKIREYVVAASLVSSLPSNLTENLSGNNQADQTGDWRDDPLGIAASWEEAHSGRKKKGKKK